MYSVDFEIESGEVVAYLLIKMLVCFQNRQNCEFSCPAALRDSDISLYINEGGKRADTSQVLFGSVKCDCQEVHH